MSLEGNPNQRQKVSHQNENQSSTMPSEENPSRGQKIARVLRSLITKESAEKRMERCAARLAEYEFVEVEESYPASYNVMGAAGPALMITYNRRVRRRREPTTTETISSASVSNNQPRHIAIQAASDQDVRSEDVADRNIARDRDFPPRVSSSAFIEKPQLVAPHQTTSQPKSVPLIPGDKFSADAADWNIVRYRSPVTETVANVPKPLAVNRSVRFE
ncbi:hypothetical protein AMS68_004516 [Peltaster fructicola]|uniref:Uncharacterized protein n=1 Tax=Peltaster fructicola TaxID=286661 RepID=A0A6H0XWK6_9PEZI|nr:hypothetical protein AMS68_004516 [Peltaster fructicola]